MGELSKSIGNISNIILYLSSMGIYIYSYLGGDLYSGIASIKVYFRLFGFRISFGGPSSLNSNS